MPNESINRVGVPRPSIGPRLLGLAVVVVYLAFLGSSWFWEGGWISELMHDHYVFFVGVPASAIVAYVLVSVLENVRGRIEFEALGVKFKGASGPIVLWVLVFLALIVAIRVTWSM